MRERCQKTDAIREGWQNILGKRANIPDGVMTELKRKKNSFFPNHHTLWIVTAITTLLHVMCKCMHNTHNNKG